MVNWGKGVCKVVFSKNHVKLEIVLAVPNRTECADKQAVCHCLKFTKTTDSAVNYFQSLVWRGGEGGAHSSCMCYYCQQINTEKSGLILSLLFQNRFSLVGGHCIEDKLKHSLGITLKVE